MTSPACGNRADDPVTTMFGRCCTYVAVRRLRLSPQPCCVARDPGLQALQPVHPLHALLAIHVALSPFLPSPSSSGSSHGRQPYPKLPGHIQTAPCNYACEAQPPLPRTSSPRSRCGWCCHLPNTESGGGRRFLRTTCILDMDMPLERGCNKYHERLTARMGAP
jgi:hypothetical protein